MLAGIVSGSSRWYPPILSGVVATPTTWDSSFNALITYQGGYQAASSHYNRGFTRTAFGSSAGIWYFEFSAPPGHSMPGVVNASLANAQSASGLGTAIAAKSIGWYRSDSAPYFGDIYANDILLGEIPAVNDTIGVILDAGRGKVAFKTTGAQSSWFQIPGHQRGDIYHAAFSGGASAPCPLTTINSGQNSFMFTVPDGAIAGFGALV